jgi:hypothetical protein
MPSMTQYRKFLQSGDWEGWRREPTDQQRGMPQPPVEKPVPEGAVLVELVPSDELRVGAMPTR